MVAYQRYRKPCAKNNDWESIRELSSEVQGPTCEMRVPRAFLKQQLWGIFFLAPRRAGCDVWNEVIVNTSLPPPSSVGEESLSQSSRGQLVLGSCFFFRPLIRISKATGPLMLFSQLRCYLTTGAAVVIRPLLARHDASERINWRTMKALDLSLINTRQADWNRS